MKCISTSREAETSFIVYYFLQHFFLSMKLQKKERLDKNIVSVYVARFAAFVYRPLKFITINFKFWNLLNQSLYRKWMETAAIGIGREYNEVSVIVAHWYNNNNKWGVAHSLACFGIVLIPFKREEKKKTGEIRILYIYYISFPLYILFNELDPPHHHRNLKGRKKERKINIHIDSSIQTPQVFFLSLVVSHGSSFAACRRRYICFII